MRLLATVVLLAVASPAVAADADEDKAKEVATAFLKAVKAKDLDAVMKTADVPFLKDDKGKPKLIEKTEDLKADLKAMLEKILDAEKLPGEVSEALDLPAIRKLLEGKNAAADFKTFEKVLGDKGYVVMLGKPGDERGAVFVRIKDGKAKVVGFPK